MSQERAPKRVMITGGSGYFGALLAERALARGDEVRIFDLAEPTDPIDADVVIGDVRDRDAVRKACEGIDVVLNNVAQVPLAKDHELFHSVNVTGTANVLLAARDAGVGKVVHTSSSAIFGIPGVSSVTGLCSGMPKVVHTSSSAIFGIPEHNPVTEDTPGRPLEAYGRAKLEAEGLCHDAAAAGLDVSIIRPRTILGHGRLGIMAILFEFIAEGAPVFVFGTGDNRYQFVHADDLADATLLAGDRAGAETYNIGADAPSTMRETITALTEHAGTGSRVRSLPTGPAAAAMRALAGASLVPFAPYHWLLYGESLYFDTTKAKEQLGWRPTRSNAESLIESYDWFLEHRAELADRHGSHHQSPVKLGALKLLKKLP